NPLNSEKASPFGTCTVYLSCAEMAVPPNTANTTATAAPAAADVARTLRGVGNDGVLNMIFAPLMRLVRDDICAKLAKLPVMRWDTLLAAASPPDSQPKVNANASTPGPRNSISNCRSMMGFGWRISWYSRCSVTVP